MLHRYKIKSYVLIAGLAAIFFLPMTVAADRAADRAMKEDGRGLESTRGNNSVAESLRQADGHPKGAHADSPHMAPPTGATLQEDQHLTGSPAASGHHSMSGAANTGNDTIACGEYNKDWRGEIRCLRTLLDTTPMAAKKGSDGLGAYGCHNKNDRQQQIHCLRNILDGNGLAPGTH